MRPAHVFVLYMGTLVGGYSVPQRDTLSIHIAALGANIDAMKSFAEIYSTMVCFPNTTLPLALVRISD